MAQGETSWTFFSNHAHVYLLLATEQAIVVREIAARVGLTERSIMGILQDLEESGYIARERVGRSNKYTILQGKTLRHSLESDVELKDLIHLIQEAKKKQATNEGAPTS